jgi:hypothetical protein
MRHVPRSAEGLVGLFCVGRRSMVVAGGSAVNLIGNRRVSNTSTVREGSGPGFNVPSCPRAGSRSTVGAIGSQTTCFKNPELRSTRHQSGRAEAGKWRVPVRVESERFPPRIYPCIALFQTTSTTACALNVEVQFWLLLCFSASNNDPSCLSDDHSNMHKITMFM